MYELVEEGVRRSVDSGSGDDELTELTMQGIGSPYYASSKKSGLWSGSVRRLLVTVRRRMTGTVPVGSLMRDDELTELTMQGIGSPYYASSKKSGLWNWRVSWPGVANELLRRFGSFPSSQSCLFRFLQNWLESRTGEGPRFAAVPERRSRPKLFYGIVLGLTIALTVQTIRLSATNSSYRAGGASIPLEDMYPASITVRRPPPPVDSSTFAVNDPKDSHIAAWRLSDDASRLPPCGRFILTPFRAGGIGSNMLIMLRGAMFAKNFRIALLVDNSYGWGYGRLEYYFEPYTIDCVPLEDWYDEKKTIPLWNPGWRTANRIRFSIDDSTDLIDHELFYERESFELQRLQRALFNHTIRPSVLPPSYTLPRPLIPAFEEYAQLLPTLLKPVPAILDDVERVKAMMRIGGEHPTIAVQVRLGDKRKEYDRSTRFIRNTFRNLTAHLEVMHGLYDRMVGCSSSQANPCYPLSPTARRFSIEKQPRAILLTIEDDALEQMAYDAIAPPPFIFDRTPNVGLPSHYTFVQKSFDNLPLAIRVASARAVIRDLILAAKETEAAVITMASNLGRLVALFAGESEALLGPEAPAMPEGRAGGRICALDAPWFSTTFLDGIWSRVPPKV
ncbi:BQ5605_C031g10930 [Microbotryum silenes-dioicae]|uniref:BQ5605_C031g10930 protein n=1 Tax=Microbotryum silenes-dioicae TaxID=796604 RepID=A0A2X0PIK1_9BASI|nr:BQ5605_C031g10930 [Microbotryum silenes-dioicae]